MGMAVHRRLGCLCADEDRVEQEQRLQIEKKKDALLANRAKRAEALQ